MREDRERGLCDGGGNWGCVRIEREGCVTEATAGDIGALAVDEQENWREEPWKVLAWELTVGGAGSVGWRHGW